MEGIESDDFIHSKALHDLNIQSLNFLRNSVSHLLDRNDLKFEIMLSTDVRLQNVQGDITTIDCDSIVNAANEHLEGGGGVDFAIHSAAGPELLDACIQLPYIIIPCGSGTERVRCPVGEAKMTPGFRLPYAKYIFHTVAPIYEEGGPTKVEELTRCYRSCLNLADSHKLNSIAFCSLGTGFYGFPRSEAAEIAIRSCAQWVLSHSESSLKRIVFVTYGDQDREIYQLSFLKYHSLS